MSEARESVRKAARTLGIQIAEDRLDQLAEAWEQAIAEADSIRQQLNPMPVPSSFDASWSKKR